MNTHGGKRPGAGRPSAPRLALVADFRARIESGDYVVDGEAVAGAMLRQLDKWIGKRPVTCRECHECEALGGESYCRACKCSRTKRRANGL